MTHTTVWQLQDAKNKFSEVVKKAIHEGPQIVSRHGEEVVIVLSKTEYDDLIRSHNPFDLVDYFRNSPLVGVEIELERDNSLPRDVQL